MKLRVFTLVASLSVAPLALGVDLYTDNMDSGAGWGVNATADTQVTFGYDYSVDGIPEAPNTVAGAATSGVKLEANLVDPGGSEQISLYPLGQSFSGLHTLRFDAWMNYDLDEVINGSSSGTTEFLGGGIFYNNTATDIGSGAQHIVTGEGGSGSDYRAFSSDGTITTFLAPGDMVAGSRNHSDPHYVNFFSPGVNPPIEQVFAGQLDAPGIEGVPGFQWVTWEFALNNNNDVDVAVIKPDLSRLPIVTIDCSGGVCGTGDNIMLFYADFFSSVTDAPELTFGIIDNVVVTDVPEPGSLALLSLAGLAFFRRR